MHKQTSIKPVTLSGIQNKILVCLFVFLFIFSGVLLNVLPSRTEAATSNTVNFQARLQQKNGALVPDGYYNVQFKLYAASSGGTELWTETYYDANGATAGNDNRVKVVNGYLTVNLGSQTAFPGSINWDQELWLTMNIGGTSQVVSPSWDGEMNPRLKLTAVPYAFSAGKLQSTTGSNSSTLSFAPQTAARSILLPDASGTICLQGAESCGFVTGDTSNFIQNGTSQQSAANFNISGNGTIGTNLNVGGNATVVGNLWVSGGIILGDGSGISNINGTNIATGTVADARLSSNVALLNRDNQIFTGSQVFRNTTNSTAAFQIQNASTESLFTVDTINKRISMEATNIRTSTNSNNALHVQDSAGGSIMNVSTNSSINYAELTLGGATTYGSIIKFVDQGTELFQIGADDYDIGGTDAFFIYNSTTESSNLAITNNGATILRGSADNNAFEVRDASNNTFVNVDTLGNQTFSLQNFDGSALFNADRTNGYIFNNGIAQTGNLIDNPGFEAGSEMNFRNGWNGTCEIGVNSSIARSGNRYARYTSNGAYGGCGSKAYSVTPGDVIYTEAWVSSTGNGEGGVYLEFKNKDGVTTGYSNSNWTNPGATWTKRTISATVPAGAHYMTLNLTVRDSATTGEYRFDDVYLRKSSESAPMLYKNSDNSTAAFQIQNASAQTLFVADTANQRVAIGPAAVPANGVLTVGTNTTTAAGGIHFGTDTSLYRSAAGVLSTGGSFNTVAGSIQTAGTARISNTGALQNITGYTQNSGSISVTGATGVSYAMDSTPGASFVVNNGFGSKMIEAISRASLSAPGELNLYDGAININSHEGDRYFNATFYAALFKSQTNNTTAFSIQRANGANVFTADTANTRVLIGTAAAPTLSTSQVVVTVAEVQTTLRVGNATNGFSFNDTATGESGKLRLYGAARNTKKITLTPEFAGAVLDGSGIGTMTAGYDSAVRKNYYKWTSSETSNQVYDVIITMAVPSDWSAWASTNPVTADAYSNNTTNTNLQATAIDTSGNTDSGLNNVSINPAPWQQGTWVTAQGATFSGTYVADGMMTLRLRMTARNNANIQLGNITLTYLSKY